MPKLILKFESAVIKEISLNSGTLTIGRKPDNDVVIDHPAVSGHHCRILFQGDTYFVEDLNSTNGTLVNDKKIIKAGVHNQDVIGIAKHTAVFMDDRPGQPAAAPTAPAAEAPKPAAPPPPAVPVAPPQAAAVPPGSSASLQANSTMRRVFEKIGGLRIIDGVVDQVDFQLTENSTYIGKSDRVTIKIKGLLAPEVAAMVSRKSDGYVLVAIKEGYPKVNGMPVDKERRLNEGDIIEAGGTKMQFYLKSA